MKQTTALLLSATVLAMACERDPVAPIPQKQVASECAETCVGEPGANGKDGVDGKDGAQGPQGERGLQGAAGANGRDGLDGVDGRDGANGIDGRDGSNGRDGLAGRNGRDGADGVTALVDQIGGEDGCVTVRSGLDLDGDAVLGEDEVEASNDVCPKVAPAQAVSSGLAPGIVSIIDVEFERRWALPGILPYNDPNTEAAVGVPAITFLTIEFDSAGEYFDLQWDASGMSGINRSCQGSGPESRPGEGGVAVGGLAVEGARFPPRFLEPIYVSTCGLWNDVQGGVFFMPPGHHKMEIKTTPRQFNAFTPSWDIASKSHSISLNIKGVLKRLGKQ